MDHKNSILDRNDLFQRYYKYQASENFASEQATPYTSSGDKRGEGMKN
jgi:hypothetical protein